MHFRLDRSCNLEEPGVAQFVVTGAAGFIGRAMCGGLVKCGHRVLGLTRAPAHPIPGVELRPIGEISPRTCWPEQLTGADIVIHLANRAHRAARRDPAQCEAQMASALARAAAASGVRRLVHMSSVRALGETTQPGAPFRPTDPPLPREDYGRAKLAIEQALLRAAQETGLDLVILRPPLVYGPAVKANVRALIRLAGSGLPLPFAGVDNRRSLIFGNSWMSRCALPFTRCRRRVVAGPRRGRPLDPRGYPTPAAGSVDGHGSSDAGGGVRRLSPPPALGQS
jgi:UDP-glucose 4-epimerase